MKSKVLLNDVVYLDKGFLISTDKSLLNKDFIYNFLTNQSYWAKGIPIEKVETSINESICFGVYHQQQQVGFARVISDKSTFAYLADVFIIDEYRKQGLSKWLIQTIMAHTDFQSLRRWMLATADAHELYEKFGFEPLNAANRWMQVFIPYQKKE
ncbi:MAG: GNAT family N-acetyltransferase [Bacteroidetes bacterium]|nr:GNAT family N-acetyltransferase [Bacteroidota bacterium]MBU1485061.1 GNAT family N-acetyltransferase [Bacteroidota bacterium]MBU2268403.1 GNAT family N-acetyltransferase [Bacteroidota bacterium]MBU2374796.1 GNAT family N-acetyltransferase [Bacteroidota bacterium]